MNEKLYTCLIEELTDEQAFVQVYWARADHMGVAIEKMLAAARLNGLKDPQPREADPYDIENLKCTVQPSPDAETFWAVDRYAFPPEPIVELPYGIIASCIEGEQDAKHIIEGYTRHKDDQGKITISINVERTALLPLYERLLRTRASYRVFWYLLHDHWTNSEDHFLVNEALDSPDKILSHLHEHPLDSVMNGYVTLTAYHEEGATNLNISDHKQIVITTYSDDIAEDYATVLADLGYVQADELVTIDDRIHHWHYRHPDSLGQPDLVDHLHSIGFRDWNHKRQ
ncbi:MAG: hypothetical protein JWM68_4677 [Verrucomicrobiales bacterium]|nr:hypothetical protein [Verrucomicrobiales bacterium]